jgi:ribosomal protein L12E/L44/L45/RPP1/RPP2
LEADARRALELAEQRLRDTADAEERRMEALVRNTSAIERLTDAIERAQQPAATIAPASEQQPQRVGRMMTGRRV